MTPAAPPTRIERAYAARLRGLVGRALARAYAPLLRRLPELVSAARVRRGDAAEARLDDKTGQEASVEVGAAAKQAGKDLASPEVRGAVKDAASDTAALSRAELGRQVKDVLGIGLAGDASLAPIVAGFVHENVKLVKNLSDEVRRRVEASVLKALTSGQLHEDLARELAGHFDFAANRAELIAVDQVGKIYGQLAIQRARDLGVTHGWWRTSKDERVRGNPAGKYPKASPSHYHRDNLYFAIAEPPRGKNGEREYPGTPVRCRCGFEPDLSIILGAPVPRAEGPQPSQEDLEAEALRLQREIEAMMAAG